MNEKKVFKKSFVLHKDALDVLDELTLEQSGELFLAIRDYQQGVELNLSSLIKIVFAPFKAQFIRDSGNYEKVREARQAAGRKGGEAKQANVANASKCKVELANVANLAVSVSDSVSDSGSDSESVSKSDSKIIDIVQPEPEQNKKSRKKPVLKPEAFKRFWNEYPENKRGGNNAQAWKTAQTMKLSDDDFVMMTNDVINRKRMSPEWETTFAQGITKYIQQEIWKTALPVQKLSQEDVYAEAKRKTAIELGLTPDSNSGNLNNDFITGVTYEHK